MGDSWKMHWRGFGGIKNDWRRLLSTVTCALWHSLCKKTFALDYMHLVCLRVLRRRLFFRKTEPRCWLPSHLQQTQLLEQLCELCRRMSSKFVRQPTSFFELECCRVSHFSLLLWTCCLKKDSAQICLRYILGIIHPLLLDSNDERRTSYMDYAKDRLHFFVCRSH